MKLDIKAPALQVVFRVALAVSVIGILAVLISEIHAQADRDPDSSMLEALRQFERQFENASFRFEAEEVYHQGTSFPIGEVLTKWSNGYLANRDLQMWQVEVRKEHLGQFRYPGFPTEQYSIDPAAMAKYLVYTTGEIQTDEYFAMGRMQGNPDQPRMRGQGYLSEDYASHYNLINGRPYSIGRLPMKILFGTNVNIRHLWLRLSDIFELSNRQVESTTLNGVSAVKLTCSSRFGVFDFWFDESDFRVLKIEHMIKRGDVWGGAGPEPNDERPVAERWGKYRHAETIESATYSYFDFDYQQFNGRRVCTGFVMEGREEFGGGDVDVYRREVSIWDVKLEPMERPKFGTLNFVTFDLPDETEFLRDDTGYQIPHIVYRGRVHRVVNEGELETLEGVRIDWSRSWGLWPWIGALTSLVLVSVVAWLVYRRRKYS